MGGVVKPRWDLMPWIACQVVAKVLTFGARKHGESQWRTGDRSASDYFAKVMRHLIAWHLGEPYDDESGLPHLAHAVANLLFLIELELDP